VYHERRKRVRLRWEAITALFTADWMCHTLGPLRQQRWQATAPVA
jgi:hypothetical protein